MKILILKGREGIGDRKQYLRGYSAHGEDFKKKDTEQVVEKKLVGNAGVSCCPDLSKGKYNRWDYKGEHTKG